MNSVPPVHVRADNNVKNPMIGTNFEDLLNKSKKHVKIGSSTIFNINNKNNRINDSKAKNFKNRNSNIQKSVSSVKNRNLSNSSKQVIAPLSQLKADKTNLSVLSKPNYIDPNLKGINDKKNEYNHKPKKEKSHQSLSPIRSNKIMPPCEVCDEAKSRSRPNSQSFLNNKSFLSISNSSENSDLSNKSFNSVRSHSTQSNIGNSEDYNIPEYPSRTSSKIYQRPNRHWSQESYFGHHYITDPNLTYTKQLPYLSRSHDSLVRAQNRYERLPSPILFAPPFAQPPPFVYDPPIQSSQLYYDTKLAENSNFLSNIHQELLKKLSDTESNANNILHKLTLLKEYLRQESNKDFKLTHRIEHDRNELIRKIELFEMSNRDLKDVIFDLTAVDHYKQVNKANNIRQEHENIELIKQLESVEAEKNHYKKMVTELEQNAAVKGNTFEALNHENGMLTNMKASLEDNRAHLRRQLLSKESEIQRLSVQLRILNQKFDRAQLEIELLRQNRERAGLSSLKFPTNSNNEQSNLTNSSKSKIKQTKLINSNTKLNKSHYNLEEILGDPIKIRLYIDKLNNQIREKDAVIKNQNDLIKKNSEVEDSKSERSEKHQAENLRKENEKLKLIIKVKDEKLKNAENKLKNEKKISHSLSNNSNNLNKKLSSNQQSLSSSDEATSTNFRNSNSTDETQPIQRTKNFTEIELDNVRSLLQERINELEPLPELLKNTELKLHESNLKIKSYESDINEYKKLINELRNELDLIRNKSKSASQNSKEPRDKNSLLSSSLVSIIQADSNQIARQQNLIENLASTSKFEHSLEKKFDSLNDEQKELIRQIALKDEYIKDLTNKLASKSEEAASYSRQLDLALNDFNIKEKQLREKFSSKERSLQAKCTELETKLNSIKLHSNVDKRDKEDLSHDYQAQIRDLKAKLEQTQVANKQMQDYVNFLKNTYVTYFNDNTLQNFDYTSSNFYSNQNNFI